MRTKWTVLLWMLMISGLLAAQNTANTSFQVKGILLDSLTQEGEPYATIKIVKKEAPAKALKMLVTDMKGQFQEKVPGTGNFVMTITSVGRTPIVKDFSVKAGEKLVDFGTLYIVDASNELGQVEVVAQKPLVKADIDKIEYNVQDDPDAQSNSVLEMLRKVPLVTVDGEDNIQVNGSSSFKVYVNGKPNNMMSNNPTEVLKSMPANTKQIQEAQTQIDKYSDSTKREKQEKKEADKQLKQQKTIHNELLSLRRQNQQSEIDLMKEGSDKKIAQINLDYDNEIAAILAKEKEWKDAQGGKLSKEQTVEIHTALVNSYVKREQSTSNVNKEQLEEEKRAMNEYLKEYGSYLEKRQAITELYNEKIARATTEGERLSLAEGMKKELADVDNEAQKSTSIITRLFDDMSKKNITSIRAIADEAEKFLSFLERGEYSSDNSFGITKEQFDVLRKSPDQLKAIKDEIANVRHEADQMETSFNKVSNGLKKVFISESDARKLKEGLAEIEEGMSEIMQTGQFLSDTFSKLGDSFGGVFGGIAEGFSVAMDTVSSAMNGAKAGSMFGPLGASAGAAIGVVTSLAGAIAKIHDKKNEKRIQRLQDQIDTLDKSYGKLEKSIEKAYSKDASKMIEQNNKLLEQQKILIQQQIREEQDKKKTDDSRIKEWQEQIEEINDVIAENKEKAKDAIFGEDLKSAIDNFANAQAEAWASGEDRAESAKDTVKKMMRQMVTESIKAATESSGAMEKIRDKLKEFYADNVLSGWEQDYIYNMAEELQKEIDRQFGWADSLMKDEVEEPEKEEVSENSLKGAYAKASQESINLLAGQTGAVRVLLEDIRGSMQPIREQMRLIYDMQSRGWEDVKAIRELSDKVEKNTDRIAENTREIKEVAGKISENTRGTVDALEGTINVKVKM